jgi:hypothetical protein
METGYLWIAVHIPTCSHFTFSKLTDGKIDGRRRRDLVSQEKEKDASVYGLELFIRPHKKNEDAR